MFTTKTIMYAVTIVILTVMILNKIRIQVQQTPSSVLCNETIVDVPANRIKRSVDFLDMVRNQPAAPVPTNMLNGTKKFDSLVRSSGGVQLGVLNNSTPPASFLEFLKPKNVSIPRGIFQEVKDFKTLVMESDENATFIGTLNITVFHNRTLLEDMRELVRERNFTKPTNMLNTTGDFQFHVINGAQPKQFVGHYNVTRMALDIQQDNKSFVEFQKFLKEDHNVTTPSNMLNTTGDFCFLVVNGTQPKQFLGYYNITRMALDIQQDNKSFVEFQNFLKEDHNASMPQNMLNEEKDFKSLVINGTEPKIFLGYHNTTQ